MKTTLTAKIIFESDSMEDDDQSTPNPENKPYFTLVRFREAINKGKIECECILGYYTNDSIPVIIIKEK